MALVTIEDVSFTYPALDQPALLHFSLTLEKGSYTLLCGPSGCGKTTLLRLLKTKLAPHGKRQGSLYWEGRPFDVLTPKEQAEKIGFVMQNPESQIVADKVWRELAFGLENLGMPPSAMKRRIGEMASFFGIADWFRADTASLSGGQKQLLNLAAVMAMQPELLLLDEPTSQLDPIAASTFLTILQKINRELGTTILLTEHRLEEVFSAADQVAVMNKGRLVLQASPAAAAQRIPSLCPALLPGLPSAIRIFSGMKGVSLPPLTVREGRACMREFFPTPAFRSPPPAPNPTTKINAPLVLQAQDLWFRYHKNAPDILRGLHLQVKEGEILALLGDNGVGKSTLLSVLAGLKRAYKGNVLVKGRSLDKYKGDSLYRQVLAFLPQNPQIVFVHNSLREEFAETGRLMGYDASRLNKEIHTLCSRLHIDPMLERHPYDLSGGEQQKAALIKTLLLKPAVLLLDEPTKGIDPAGKSELSCILKELQRDGTTLLMVTHDVEFAAEAADRCALLFDGEVVGIDTPDLFFSENHFYTTAASRISRPIYQRAVTCAAVRSLNISNGGDYAESTL